MPQPDLYDHVLEAADYILSRSEIKPVLAFFLGSGYGSLVEHVIGPTQIHYADIPYMQTTSVKGHQSLVVTGMLFDVPVIVWCGRMHWYEGRDMNEITFPVRASGLMGVKNVIFTNAAGGLNPLYQVGDLVILRDHINLFPSNPLIGYHDPRWGARFPDMSEIYNLIWIEKALELSTPELSIHTGVYAGLSGPSLETPAEYRYLRIIGADLVGMSTIPEVVVAHQLGMRIMAISVISNKVNEQGRAVNKTTHEGVLDELKESMYKVINVFRILLSQLTE